MLRKVSVGLLVSLQLVACGGGSSKKGGNQPVPPTPVPAPSNPDQNAGIIDETKPAEVDLQNHMVFDQLVSSTAKEGLRRDLTRIERFDLTTGTENDEVLKSLLKVSDLKPATLSTWLKDRVRYMLNEDLSLYRLGAIVSQTKSYEVFRTDPSDPEDTRNIAAAMTGTMLYQIGKNIKESNPEVDYLMVEINNNWVHANTLRNGVMQIGPALFHPDFQPNSLNPKAYANTAIRVDTLFHEARHADGNSAASSLGFKHTICPAGSGIASEFVGQHACDDNANGPYTVGARILKAYVKKCGSLCSRTEKTILESALLDSLSRVVKRSSGELPLLDATPEEGFEKVDISTFSLIPTRSN